MKTFLHNQRVKIASHDLSEMIGKIGTVARQRRCDEGAWINIDENLPSSHIAFPDPDDSRHRHILLYPDECTQA